MMQSFHRCSNLWSPLKMYLRDFAWKFSPMSFDCFFGKCFFQFLRIDPFFGLLNLFMYTWWFSFFFFFWLFILKKICVFFSNRIYFRIWLLPPTPKLKLKSFVCFELASSWIFFKVWLHLHPFTRFLFIQQ